MFRKKIHTNYDLIIRDKFCPKFKKKLLKQKN